MRKTFFYTLCIPSLLLLCNCHNSQHQKVVATNNKVADTTNDSFIEKGRVIYLFSNDTLHQKIALKGKANSTYILFSYEVNNLKEKRKRIINGLAQLSDNDEEVDADDSDVMYPVTLYVYKNRTTEMDIRVRADTETMLQIIAYTDTINKCCPLTSVGILKRIR